MPATVSGGSYPPITGGGVILGERATGERKGPGECLFSFVFPQWMLKPTCVNLGTDWFVSLCSLVQGGGYYTFESP